MFVSRWQALVRSARRATRLALLVAGMLASLIATDVHAQAGRPALPSSVVPELPLAARAERQEIRAQLVPVRYTTLASEIGARIRRLPFAEAQAFRVGDVLAVLDCSVNRAHREKARAELAAAEATLKANEKLAALNSIGELELILAETAVRRARAEIGAQDAVLEKCTLVAPFSGRVAEYKVREQQFVQPGQSLMDVLDDSALEVEFLAPSFWLGWIRIGYGMQVSIDETRRSYPAQVTRIGARVDPVSQSVKITATIDGRFSELIAGMSGQVQIRPPSP